MLSIRETDDTIKEVKSITGDSYRLCVYAFGFGMAYAFYDETGVEVERFVPSMSDIDDIPGVYMFDDTVLFEGTTIRAEFDHSEIY